MMPFILLTVFFGLLAFFVYWMTRPKPSKAYADDVILQNQINSCKYDLTTIKGAKIKSCVPALSLEFLAAVDNGFDELEASLPRNGYQQSYDRSKQIIFVVQPDRLKDSDGNIVANFKVQISDDNPYVGSEYDHVDAATGKHFIYAAERVLDDSIDSGVNKWLVCLVSDNFQNVIDAVRFGGEHTFLYHADTQKYNATAYHGAGAGHPILP